MSGGDFVVNITQDRQSGMSEKYDADRKYTATSTTRELVDTERPKMAGRRRTSDKLAPPKIKNDYDGEGDEVNSLGHLYSTILSFNGPIRYTVYILPVSVLIAIPLILFATVYSKVGIGRDFRALGLMVWLQVSWGALWITKIIAQLIPFVFQVVCGFVSSGTRKYRMIIEKLEIPISLFFWTIVAYATFDPITTIWTVDGLPKKPSADSWVSIWSRIWLASIAVSAAFLVEKLFVQLISINYHSKYDGKTGAQRQTH